MRVVVQRALNAKCEVDGQTISQIDKGFMILVGFEVSDKEDILDKMAYKVSGLRIFEDENNKMNRSIKDVGGKILSISQFTLYADASHGHRPSFINAMKSDEASRLYDRFNEILQTKYGVSVLKGKFGADMKISFTNDGPVTILLDSKDI